MLIEYKWVKVGIAVSPYWEWQWLMVIDFSG